MFKVIELPNEELLLRDSNDFYKLNKTAALIFKTACSLNRIPTFDEYLSLLKNKSLDISDTTLIANEYDDFKSTFIQSGLLNKIKEE